MIESQKHSPSNPNIQPKGRHLQTRWTCSCQASDGQSAVPGHAGPAHSSVHTMHAKARGTSALAATFSLPSCKIFKLDIARKDDPYRYRPMIDQPSTPRVLIESCVRLLCARRKSSPKPDSSAASCSVLGRSCWEKIIAYRWKHSIAK